MKQNKFYNNKKIFLLLPIILLVLSVVTTLIFSVRQDTKFAGGTFLGYSYKSGVSAKKVEELAKGFMDGKRLVVSVQTDNPAPTATVNTRYVFVTFPNVELDDGNAEVLLEKFKEAFPDSELAQVDFAVTSRDTRLKTVAKYAVAAAIILVALAVFAAIRYKRLGGLKVWAALVAALATNAIIAYTIFVMARIELSSNLIAIALLAFGFTLYHSILIFDKIKDYRKKETSLQNAELVGFCIERMYYRISFTTILGMCALGLLTILAICFGAFPLIKLSLPLVIVLLGGAYTALYLAPPIWSKLAKPFDVVAAEDIEAESEEE